jgi:hypothetical protein
MLMGMAGALAGLAVVVAFMWANAEPTVQTAAPATAPPAPPRPAVVESGPAPAWTGQRQARWAADGSKTITFELAATRDIPVWMGRARPVLVVRCLSRQTDAFVALGTSASYADETDRRTVEIQRDDDPPVAQQWDRSESGQELFAPDGRAFVRQLTNTSRLRFSFTPFNAPPATVEFAVHGFDELAGLVAGTCGWRLGEGPTPARTARLR